MLHLKMYCFHFISSGSGVRIIYDPNPQFYPESRKAIGIEGPHLFHSVLSASTGFNFSALRAGQTEDMIAVAITMIVVNTKKSGGTSG